jgi:tetratricopeptide (TPR) repeat protein
MRSETRARGSWFLLLLSFAVPGLAEPGGEELTDPAGFVKIVEESKLTYEIGVQRPVPNPVPDLECPSRSPALRLVASSEGKSLVLWEPSKEAAAHFEAAEKLFAEKRFPEAAVEYRKGLALDPEYGLGWLYSGDVPFHRGDYESALAAYRKALALDPTHPQAHHFAAHALLKLGRLDDAETESVRALVYDPSYAGAWAGLRHLGRLAAFTVQRHEFSPPADALGQRQGDRVSIAVDESGEWLGYLLCKAVWRNEPDYRRRKNGGQEMDEGSWSLTEERECLANYIATNFSLARARLEEEAARKGLIQHEISEEQALAAAPALVRHLHEVAAEGLLDGFIAFEYLGRRCPMAVSLLPEDVLDQAERYIRRFVILRR